MLENISVRKRGSFSTQARIKDQTQQSARSTVYIAIMSGGAAADFDYSVSNQNILVFGSTLQRSFDTYQDPEDLQWEGFALQLAQDRPRLAISEDQIKIANTIRCKFKAQIHRNGLANVLQPQASPQDGILQISWDSPSHHIDFEVDPNKEVAWFYMNLETDQSTSGQWSWSGSYKKIPKDVWPYLQRLLSDSAALHTESRAR
jgi:hypothetical protein